MNKDKLNRIKEKYKKQIARNNKLIDLKNKLEELETKKIIITYNKIKKILEENDILDEEKILRDLFSYDILKDIECNIYVFDDAYILNQEYDARSDYVCPNIEVSDYVLYKNLTDPWGSINISPSKYKEFEENNIIIKFIDRYYKEVNFYKLRDYYLKETLNDKNEEEILEEIYNNRYLFGINKIIIPNKNDIKEKKLKKEEF